MKIEAKVFFAGLVLGAFLTVLIAGISALVYASYTGGWTLVIKPIT